MRRKNLISPEKPAEDLIKYRFKQLLFPNFSYAIAITILFAFIFGIFAVVSIKSISNAILAFIIFSLVLLAVELLAVWFVFKKSDIVMTSENISAVDYLYRRKSIDWEEIILLKQYDLLGARYFSIKTTDGKSVQIIISWYNIFEIIDRVRKLAGEDHILVRALEKELSRPRKELIKLWCGVIGSISLTMSIYLIGGNMYAAEQEKPLEQSIAIYVRQHPKIAPNQSAIELQSLMNKLGLSVENFGNGSKVKVKPVAGKITEWKAIEPTLKKYLDKQLDKAEDSIDSVPTNLTNYLKTHQADFIAIASHLINNPIPQWGSDSNWIKESNLKGGDSPLSPLMKYLDLLNTENLLIANIFDKQQLPNANISSDLAAIEKIQQSIQAQPSLIGQIVARIGEKKITKLVRQVNRIPSEWGNHLFKPDRHKHLFDAIEGAAMMNSRVMQNSYLFNQLLIEQESPLRFIPGFYQLARPQIRLFTVDRYRETQQSLAYWHKQNICHTDGKDRSFKSSPLFGLADDYFFLPTYLSGRYPNVLVNDLKWELANSVRQIKAKLATGEKVDLAAREFNVRSTICPGEQWTAKTTDGAVTIEFSHPPDWKALGASNSNDIEPLMYKIKSIDTSTIGNN
jgi:hypothetical protein